MENKGKISTYQISHPKEMQLSVGQDRGQSTVQFTIFVCFDVFVVAVKDSVFTLSTSAGTDRSDKWLLK